MSLCRIHFRFPFFSITKTLSAWSPFKRNTKYSKSDRKFLDYVKSELGNSPKTQTKVFLTSELIAHESRNYCETGGLSVDARKRELRLEDDNEYLMWIAS